MTTEQKKPSLLFLFLIIGISSFTTGALFGLWVLPKSQKKSNDTNFTQSFSEEVPVESENQKTLDPSSDSSSISNETPQNQEESVLRYRNMLQQTLEDETGENIEYGIYLNRFSQNERANDFSIQMKEKYPIWDVTVYEQDNFFIVFIGPFSSSEEAQSFMNGLPKIPELKNSRVIKIAL